MSPRTRKSAGAEQGPGQKTIAVAITEELAEFLPRYIQDIRSSLGVEITKGQAVASILKRGMTMGGRGTAGTPAQDPD